MGSSSGGVRLGGGGGGVELGGDVGIGCGDDLEPAAAVSQPAVRSN
jgi:hypothetical protein